MEVSREQTKERIIIFPENIAQQEVYRVILRSRTEKQLTCYQIKQMMKNKRGPSM